MNTQHLFSGAATSVMHFPHSRRTTLARVCLHHAAAAVYYSFGSPSDRLLHEERKHH
jgi:hypothetical protein